jgi:iron-sulfur cluster assembly accessory protein
VRQRLRIYEEEEHKMTGTMTHGLEITEAAKAELRRHIESADVSDLSEGEKLRLRVEIKVGGCAGFQYLPFVLTPELREDDLIKDFDGVEVVVDGMTAPYITGATFDFVDTFQKRSFEIDNPNSQGSCACGSSFS